MINVCFINVQMYSHKMYSKFEFVFQIFFLQYFIILEIYPLGYVFEKHFLISIVVGFIVLVRCYKSHSSK